MPELLEQLLAHLAAVGRAVRLQLRLVGAAELAGRDLVAFDAARWCRRRRRPWR